MRLVPYTSELFEEDGQVVALCPELNVSSYGDTSLEALDSLKEAVALFLEEWQRMGTLEVVLEEAGYRREPVNTDRWIYRQPPEGRSHCNDQVRYVASGCDQEQSPSSSDNPYSHQLNHRWYKP